MQLIEPFVDAGGEWPRRLRYMMEGHDLEKSRRYFELFLRLLDNGTLDDARDRFASNGTFWSMLYGLAEERPTWCAEVAAHWLDRQVARARLEAKGEESLQLPMHDDSGIHELFESARRAPDEFLDNVLPAVIRAAEATSYRRDDGLPRDSIWTFRTTGEYISLDSAYLAACEAAFELVAKRNSRGLKPYISKLRESWTYTANSLLLSAYLEAPEMFAEEAMVLVCSQPDRLVCGYHDSSHWISKCLIEKCSPHCSSETFAALETILAEYTTSYEREDGAELCGRASFTLLCALPPLRRSRQTDERIAALAARFGEPDPAPRGIRSCTVISPIAEEAAVEMTDDEWLAAIAEYNTKERHRDWDHPEKGGAEELAGMMQTFVQRQPERFAKLALRFPADIQPAYLMNVLYGLKEARISTDLKVDVARKAFHSTENGCLKAAADLLSKVEGGALLPEDAISFVIRCATEHPDPDRELWRADKQGEVAYFGGDILTCGINTVRGRTAEAIRDLIFQGRRYLDAFRPALEGLVRDANISVRACAASTLLAVAVHDAPAAISLFRTLADADDVLLGTHFAEDFIRRGLTYALPSLREHIERMLKSENDKVRQAGGRLACLAHLSRTDADDLVATALSNGPPSRLGVAEIVEHNLTNGSCRDRCERILFPLFNDEDSAVKEKAARCFWHLWQKPNLPLTDYQELIRHFITSAAFVESPTYLLHALEDSRQLLPEVVLDVCEHFVLGCGDLARDVRTHHAGDERTVGPLVFRAYQQLACAPGQLRALDLIDRMCEEGLTSAARNLAEFER